jgi:DNA-binding transcriptional regulator LsrR (DeoR family)
VHTNDHYRLLIKLARLYYEQGLTHGEIAERLRLSRQKVQRLVVQASQKGIVQIVIRPLTGTFGDLEKNLENLYQLREVLIVETTAYDNQSVVAREVGVGAADYLKRVVRSHDRIVISWGESLLGMVNALSVSPPVEAERTVVIQGLGGLADPNEEFHASDLTRRLAKALRAQAFLLLAPAVAANEKACKALMSDNYLGAILERARKANLAFMGIGAPRPDSLLVREGSIVNWSKLADLIKRGAVGDINLRYFDMLGHRIASELDDRIIGLTLDEIKEIELVVGVAGGSAKYQAIQGALMGKLVDVLITDHITAQRLLDPKRKHPKTRETSPFAGLNTQYFRKTEVR